MSSTDINEIINMINKLQAHSSGKASGTVTMYDSSINNKDKYKEIFELKKNVDKDIFNNALSFLVEVFKIEKDEDGAGNKKTPFEELLNGDLEGLISFRERSTPYGYVKLLKTDQSKIGGKEDKLYKLFAAKNSQPGEGNDVHSTLTAYNKNLKDGDNIEKNKDALETLKLALDLLEKADVEDLKSLNKDVLEQINKLKNFTTTVKTSSPSSSWKSLDLPSMSGGARNFVGEFEAYKNTMNMERSSIKMIGGSNVWAPGLEKDATRRSTLFAQVFSSVKAELKKHNKALSDDDSKAIEDAINSLAKRESNIYGELKTLNKYAQLLNKYKDVKDGEVVKALKDNHNISALVSKYFKDVARADKKSSKLGAVFGSLMMSLPGGLVIGL